jgi:hypothetical protein
MDAAHPALGHLAHQARLQQTLVNNRAAQH